MYANIGFVMCFLVGSSVAYYPQREAPYYSGPNDPYTAGVNQVPNSIQEPSQRLFWGSQGSNQVGGTGLWATLTNKFPFLGSMFGRMELPTQYGVPNQNDVSPLYGAPGNLYPGQQQVYQQVPQQRQQQFGQQFPQQFQQQFPQQFQQQFPQQFQQQFPRQFPQQFGQRFAPSGRDVGITDDAVIVTPPFVPPAQPAPIPSPVPAPAPVPVPAPEPTQDQGYRYNRPQIRLELPQK